MINNISELTHLTVYKLQYLQQ